jgi:hypothetical protein
MFMRALTWIFGICVVIAGATWLGKGDNGAELGDTAGDAVNGAFDGIQAFINSALG